MNDADITVIRRDGTPGEASVKDVQLFEQAQTLLKADEHFRSLRAPSLSRAELHADEQDTEAGYLYLRYDVPGSTPQEFWAHWGARDRVAWKSGQISVKADG